MSWKKNVVISCILRPPIFILLFLQQLTTSYDGYRILKKDGDVMVGGILNVHYSNSETGDRCNKFSGIGLGNAEAVMYVIESINKNSTLLPNVTIGYDLDRKSVV